MKNILILMLSVCLTQLLSAQKEKVIFSDDFSSNKNNWSTHTVNQINYLVYNNKYILDANDSLTYNVFVPVKIDTTKNYVISATMVHTTGTVNAAFGIYFGGTDVSNYYAFDISANGYYKVEKATSANYSNLVPWTTSALVKQGNYVENEIRIIREGIYWKLMINGQLVNTIPAEPLLGDKIGFTKNYPQRIEFDNLKVIQN
ncbi:MAG: hypothetical protein ABI675_01635 [Chitinophagaceae bacterium]